MPRKPFIAGNWKMNTSQSQAVELAAALAGQVGSRTDVDLAVCPPFVYLSSVAEALRGSRIALGAQNVCFASDGAFTGEISTAMLKDVGCRYVILGHSERRHVFGETDDSINRKVVKALADGLDVIFCVGELLAQREAGETTDVVTGQMELGLKGIGGDDVGRVTIAYEPVWAIGTGVTASPDQAQEVHAMIRRLVATTHGQAAAEAIRIQYGGSVKPSNAAELLSQPDIDGALVGGASLKVEQFVGIAGAGR